MKILGIETSCDDTGIAIYDSDSHKVVHLLYSQVESHKIYGGVVPELASRDHIRKILPLLTSLCTKSGHKLKDIDGISYTKGPGLAGALLVGSTFAKSLSYALNKPCIGVHHLEAHILAVMLEKNVPEFPFMGLLVSGGHTMLIKVIGIGNYEILGQTVDDAVGECFDKTAKLIGLEYPGGPKISALAKLGESNAYVFPKPMLNSPNLNFSFSGLKTHVRRVWETLEEKSAQQQANIAAVLEKTIVDILVAKTKKAMIETGLTKLVLAGGVAANVPLRGNLKIMCQREGGEFYCPDISYCTDNGAMVAYTGFRYLSNDIYDNKMDIEIKPRWELPSIIKNIG